MGCVASWFCLATAGGRSSSAPLRLGPRPWAVSACSGWGLEARGLFSSGACAGCGVSGFRGTGAVVSMSCGWDRLDRWFNRKPLTPTTPTRMPAASTPFHRFLGLRLAVALRCKGSGSMRVGSGTPAGPLLERTVAGLSMFFDFTALDQGLPAFAESPVRKGGNKCEKDVHRSLGDGGSASAGCAEDVKMRRAAVE